MLLSVHNLVNFQLHIIFFLLHFILEEVTPKNDDFLRLRREELWIRRYQSIEFGANKHS